MARTMTAQQIPSLGLLFEQTASTTRDEPSPAGGVQVLTPPAIVRTISPMAAGFVLAFLASHNIQVSAQYQEYLVGGLTVLLGGAYYVVASALQSRWHFAGLLLGSTAKPTYTEGRHRKTSIGSTTATSNSPDDRQ
jgi:hypothetical protein